MQAPGIADPDGKPGENTSRWVLAERAGGEPDLPDIEAGDYLVEAFAELGMVSATADGMLPIQWSEIEAFARVERLRPDEAKLMRTMSVAYLDGRDAGMSPLGKSPMEAADD